MLSNLDLPGGGAEHIRIRSPRESFRYRCRHRGLSRVRRHPEGEGLITKLTAFCFWAAGGLSQETSPLSPDAPSMVGERDHRTPPGTRTGKPSTPHHLPALDWRSANDLDGGRTRFGAATHLATRWDRGPSSCIQTVLHHVGWSQTLANAIQNSHACLELVEVVALICPGIKSQNAWLPSSNHPARPSSELHSRRSRVWQEDSPQPSPSAARIEELPARPKSHHDRHGLLPLSSGPASRFRCTTGRRLYVSSVTSMVLPSMPKRQASLAIDFFCDREIERTFAFFPFGNGPNRLPARTVRSRDAARHDAPARCRECQTDLDVPHV